MRFVMARLGFLYKLMRTLCDNVSVRGYAAQAGGGAAVDALMRRLRHVRSSGPYTRDEMNEQ
jgi:hypothetical protein